jgi:hypothetical protein
LLFFPTFISSCGFGFIRKSAPIRRFVSSNPSFLVLAMRKKALDNIDPKEIFLQARRFLSTERLLWAPIMENPKLSAEVAQPCMVMSALSSELFLKCLICLEKGVVPAGHHLAALYEELANDTKIRIEQKWDSEIVPLRGDVWNAVEVSTNGKIVFEIDLPSALQAGNRAFEHIRYNYEPESVNSDFYIGDLPALLMKVILQKKPEWENLEHEVKQIAPNGWLVAQPPGSGK